MNPTSKTASTRVYCIVRYQNIVCTQKCFLNEILFWFTFFLLFILSFKILSLLLLVCVCACVEGSTKPENYTIL